MKTLGFWVLFLWSILELKGQHIFYDEWVSPKLICSDDKFIYFRFRNDGAFQPILERCLESQVSVNEFWAKFSIKTNSTLAFTIHPENPNDDVDFILYKSLNGVPGEIVRCMNTGINLDENKSSQSRCLGSTGLRWGENDIYEYPGCSSNQNNFLQPVDAKEGEEFLLLITNYGHTSGFSVEWTGTQVFDPDLCTVMREGLSLKLQPNPANDRVFLTISSKNNQSAVIRLINKQGNALYTQDVFLREGETTLDINIKTIPAGDYFIHAVTQQGAQQAAKLQVVN